MGKIGSCAWLITALLLASASAPVIPPRQLTEREKVTDAVVKYAKQFNLDTDIFMAQCWVESYYKASMVERDPDTGTRISFGPLQVHEEVGERAWIAYGGAGKYAPELCLSPDFGVYAGARHMRWLLDRSGGSYLAALSKHNLGERGYAHCRERLSSRKVGGKRVHFYRRYIERIEKKLGRPIDR